jgi:hypothetical protein
LEAGYELMQICAVPYFVSGVSKTAQWNKKVETENCTYITVLEGEKMFGLQGLSHDGFGF